MSAHSQEQSLSIVGISPRTNERRRNRRFKIEQPIRLRPCEFVESQYEELRLAENISRDGIYFITPRDCYYKGMQLYVTCLYSTSGTGGNLDYIGRVVRVEHLSDGQRGVAIHLVKPMKFKTSTQS